MKRQSSGVTPAAPRRNPVEADEHRAAHDLGGSGGPSPAARAVSSERWSSACSSGATSTPARWPSPVVTPYAGTPVVDVLEHPARASLRPLERGWCEIETVLALDDPRRSPRASSPSSASSITSGTSATVPMPAARARSTARQATATSVVARPRCQKTIRSPSLDRPGFRPATISPSSACSDSAVKQAGPDLRPQRAERIVPAALPPVVDDDLVERVEHVELEHAHRAVRDQERACSSHAVRRIGSGRSSRVASTTMSAPRRPPRSSRVTRTGLPSASSSRLPERTPRLVPPARDPDLAELEESVEHRHVRERGAAGAEMGEHPRLRPAELAGSERRQGPGAPLRDLRSVDDRDRHARSRIVEGDERELGRAGRECGSRRSRRRPSHPSPSSGQTVARRRLKWPGKDGSGTWWTRGSSVDPPLALCADGRSRRRR